MGEEGGKSRKGERAVKPTAGFESRVLAGLSVSPVAEGACVKMEHRTHIPGSSNGGGGESRAEEWEKNTRVREKGAEIVKHREDRKGGPKGTSQH